MRDVVECVSKSGGSDYDDVRRDVVVNKQNKKREKLAGQYFDTNETSQWIFPIHEKRPASSTASAPQLVRD